MGDEPGEGSFVPFSNAPIVRRKDPFGANVVDILLREGKNKLRWLFHSDMFLMVELPGIYLSRITFLGIHGHV